MSRRQTELDAVYSVLDELAVLCGGPWILGECDGRMDWPQRGVYFFFEPGESRQDGLRQRVVRVGTHALRPSKSTLWGRLSQHRGTAGGRFAGGGNHRGSIFRLHVGEALLAAGDYPPEISQTWGRGSAAPPEVRRMELPLERDVSARIRAMPFLWVEVDDPPGPSSERGVIERASITLLSNFAKAPIDPASPTWLGRQSTRATIRESGLWNVNHVRDTTGEANLLYALQRHLT